MEKSILSEELNAMKYLLGYKRGVVISEQQFGNEKFNFNPNTGAVQGGGINYTPTAPADMLKNAQAAVAGVTTPATGTPAAPATQQKFNFNPYPNLNLNPESAINLKMQTPQELAKAVASATPAAAPAAPAANLSMPDLIKQLQTILKTKFNATLGNTGPNKDGIDGVWGKNSQTAFENALKTLPAAAAAPTTGTTTVVAGAPAAGTGTPPAAGTGTPPAAGTGTQQKVNFNPNNFNPESGINFKPSTPKL